MNTRRLGAGLAGQVAIVTGASRGIGRAVATRLGQLGASVVVNYARDATSAARTVATVEASGARAIAVQADVSSPADITALFAAAHDRFGQVDVVVANAGLDEGLGAVLDITEDDYDRIYSVNAKGAFFTLQSAARSVSNGGSIVYIGSGSTSRPVPGFGLYSSSKVPGNYLVGVLAQELGHRDVTVNAVLASATEGAGYFTQTRDGDRVRDMVQGASPIGSRMGTGNDVADAVEYLTGPLARWVSGQQLLVAGGQA